MDNRKVEEKWRFAPEPQFPNLETTNRMDKSKFFVFPVFITQCKT